jgi:hypothetical protein
VLSKNGLYTRTYRVTVEMIAVTSALPRISSFRFSYALNSELVEDTVGTINEGSGIILIDARYAGPSAPESLIPEFSAPGIVTVTGIPQTSGMSGQNFSRQVKYSVASPDNPALKKDYWVQVRFIRDSSSDAAITAFSFHPAENSGLGDELRARIDQGTGQIYIYAPLGSGAAAKPMIPRFSAQGKVTVGGQVQTSGANSHVFSGPLVYQAESANGLNRKSYTVTVQEMGTTLYVRQGAGGRNNGASWEDAFVSLQAACEAALAFPAEVPREIWIAAGTYRPSETGDAAAYFPISSNTSYIGGFSGWETSKGQRNPAANRVIISGDLGAGLRSRRLFKNNGVVSGDIVFDGLSFTGARGTNSGDRGPGINLDSGGTGGAEIQNCEFTDLESAGTGGALYIRYPALGLSGVTITNTKASGDGVYVDVNGPLDVKNVLIEDVGCSSSGSGLYIRNSGSSSSVSGLTIKHTKASGSGRGAYIDVGGSLDVKNVTVEDVEASGSGGGLSITNGSGQSTIISGLTINKTTSTGSYSYGGGAYISVRGPLNLTDVKIEGAETSGSYGGGGLYVENNGSGSTIISGLTINKTTSTGSYSNGGGAYISVRGPLNLTGVKIEEAETSGNGGGLFISNYVAGQSTSVSGLNIKKTKSSGPGGGGAYISVRGPLNLTGVKIEEAETSGDGGGLYIINNSGQGTSISDLTITDAGAQYGGGAMIYANGPLGLEDVEITDAEASSGSGGGLFISNSSGQRTSISKLAVTNAKALGGSGGGLYISAKDLRISDYTSTATRAGNSGGSLYINLIDGGSASINGASISNSQAENSASDNFAHGGGGIFISGGSSASRPTAAFSGITFSNVRAGGTGDYTHGGAVFCDRIRLTMEDCSISNAGAKRGGGAIAGLGDSSCVLARVSFANCSADYGSILYGCNDPILGGGIAYTIMPGCMVGNTLITTATLPALVLSNMVSLEGDSTIALGPDL